MSFTNTLYTADNLFILCGMNSDSVDLIYLDPPFNSKRIYEAPVGSKAAGTSFKDMWTWEDVNFQYLETMAQKYPILPRFITSALEMHSKAMASYLTYMAQRIIEMHRVLKDTGSIYLHCDPTASHYLKGLMDIIFGKNNFRNEIIWQRNNSAGKGSQFKSKKFGANTDTILFYTKTDNFNFVSVNADFDESKFDKVDENGRKYNTDTPVWRSKSMGARPNLCYEWRGFRNPHPSGWRLSKERLEEEYQKGNIVIKTDYKRGLKIERRKYIDDYAGSPLDNNWVDIPRVAGKERTGYPTQKPLALLHRIIKASSNEGDIVLDPFCGCATACVASQELGRKWIGIDIEKNAVNILVNRLGMEKGVLNQFIHRTDTPKRTDVENVEPTKANVKERLFKEQKGCCNGCSNDFRIVDFHIDHIIPRNKGGGDYYENYQLLCGNCNTIKGNRPMEYLRMKIEVRDKILRERLTFGE